MQDKLYSMGNPWINPNCFNPNILYIIREHLKDVSTATHPASDFITFIYVLSGGCTYIINDIPYKVKKGDIVVCNPGSTHRKILNHGDEIMEFNVGFNNINLSCLPKNYLLAENEYPVIRLVKYGKEISKCCEEMISEKEKNEPGFDLLLKSLSMKLISSDRSSIVQSIIKFINENYMKEISLESISKNMYFSSVYISKIFKEETGDSPINYLIKVRLSKAKELLQQESISIKASAKSVGYHDAYYFSKLFKKYYGFSPSKLIK